MKLKSEIIKDIKSKFDAIGNNEIEIFKEVLLILNLRSVPHNYSAGVKLLNLIKQCQGNSLIANWKQIIDECEDFIKQNPAPERNSDNTSAPYDYISNLIEHTQIALLNSNLNDDLLLRKIQDKLDIQKLYYFLCYAHIENYLLTTNQVPDAILNFSTNLMVRNNDLYPYIHAYEILDLKDKVWLGSEKHFFMVCNQIKKVLISDDNFETFFQNLTGETFENFKVNIEARCKELHNRIDEEMRNRR